MILEVIPPILIFHLKRFAFEDEKALKIDKFIEFPEQLVLSQQYFATTIPLKLRKFQLYAGKK